MPSWIDLIKEFDGQQSPADKMKWLDDSLTTHLQAISTLRQDSNVIFYASAFLQKASAPSQSLSISYEDINGFMPVMHQMDFTKGLTLLLHTPGGVIAATEPIVSYLRSKFTYVEVIVPAYAMSAGTMIALSADKIVMGRQSQLGPIDSQMPINGRTSSAAAILEQFEQAKKEISADPRLVNAWAPILASYGSSLLQEARHALSYSEQLVTDWLQKFVLPQSDTSATKAAAIAKHFSQGSNKKNHGRRIDREEARAQGVTVENLEDSQPLQEAVLTAYHIMTMYFEKTSALKLIASNHDKRWIRNP